MYSGCLTWHDDVGEAQFPGHSDSSAEDQRVFSAELIHVSSQQLKGDDET